jgi:hypothetical protein
MNIPKFTAASSLRYDKESFRYVEQFITNDVGVILQDRGPARGPVGDCLCCIATDSYACCARCVDWILS